MTEEEVRADLRNCGISEEVIKYFRCYDSWNLPAEFRENAQPNGTRYVMEATINAAIRHGSDGHGKDGLVGYMLVLERTTPKIFIRLMEMAQQWQAAMAKKTPRPTDEQVLAEPREAALPEDFSKLMHPADAFVSYDLDYDPYDDPEADEEG